MVEGELGRGEGVVERVAPADQHNAVLVAQLSVLSTISEAVAMRGDIHVGLRRALAACFHAGISSGALYLSTDRSRRVLRVDDAFAGDLDDFFGFSHLLDAAITTQTPLLVPSDTVPPLVADELLARAKASSLLLVPLSHRSESLGALLLVSQTSELKPEVRLAFALAVAGQMSLALTMARAFAAKDASEQAASTQARVLRSVLDSITDAVVVSDATATIRSWNRAAEDIVGFQLRPDERWSIFEPDRITPLLRDRLPLLRACRGEAIRGVEIVVRDREAAPSNDVWLTVNAQPLRDDSGSLTGAVAVFRDITTERAAHAQLLVGDRMASLGTLAAGVGHEINNPLATVLMNVDLAVAEVEKLALANEVGPLLEVLRDTREGGERIRQIVRDLKLFARSDDEKVTSVEVKSVLESSLRMAWTEIRHRAKVVRDYAKVPSVVANEARLGQVFLNLIVNAAQAIPDGRANDNEIRVTTRLQDGGVRIEIADTGEGISPEVRARLFTPFFTTKPAGFGTGLGLAICHRLVTAIGGTIDVESVVGRGSVFGISLPSGAAARTRSTRITTLPFATRRGRVLVIDDETPLLVSLQRTLGKEHDVVGLCDAREALHRINSGERYDAILCDLMMPNYTGIDLYCDLMMTVPDQAKMIVFMSGGIFTNAAAEFLDSVENQKLDKPFDVRVLRTIINELVMSR